MNLSGYVWYVSKPTEWNIYHERRDKNFEVNTWTNWHGKFHKGTETRDQSSTYWKQESWTKDFWHREESEDESEDETDFDNVQEKMTSKFKYEMCDVQSQREITLVKHINTKHAGSTKLGPET